MTDMSKFKVANAFKHLDPNQGLADGVSAGFSSVRYRGKAWTLVHGGKTYPFRRDDDGTPLSYIDVVILGVNPGLSKVYFGGGEWTEESSSGPICASLKGDVPDPGVPVPQSKACNICPNNDWVVKPNGSKGKPCQDHKRMAVLLMPAMTKKMLGSALMEPVYLKIPPGSLKSLKSYSDELQSEGLPFATMVTRISFNQERIFEMTFTPVQALTDAEAPRVLPLMDDRQTRAIVGGMPGVREIAPPKPSSKVDTGLMEAFGSPSNGNGVQPAPKPRTARKAPVIDNDPPPKGAEAGGETPWEESDTDLDDTVAKLMGDKMNKMMK